MEGWDTALLRLALSTLLSGLIGLEREARNQPAGFRTHIVLGVGSTLVMLVSIHMAQEPSGADPSRIAAQVVSGIGFLGAGAIIRIGTSIRGLTTATSLWTVAAIGLAVGSGYYVGAVFTTVLIIVTLSLFGKAERILLGSKALKVKKLTVLARNLPGIVKKVEGILEEHSISTSNLQIDRTLLDDRLEVRAIIRVPDGLDLGDVTSDLTRIEGVMKVEMD